MLGAALVYVLLAVVFVSPALFTGRVLGNVDVVWFKPPWDAQRPASLVKPSNPELDDIPVVILPFAQYARDRAPDVALWNPYITSGRPFLADAQSGVFSPFSLLWYAFGVVDGLVWLAMLKFFLAGLGTFLLGRSLGMRFGGALFAGVVFAFNQWMVEWLFYPHASVWALMPWLLFVTDRLVRRPDALSVAATALVAALTLLSGHPESAFHAFVAAGIFFLVRAGALHRRRPRGVLRPLLAFAAAVAVALAIAAVALLPFAELLHHSADVKQRAGVAKHSWFPADDLMQMFLSDYFGRPTNAVIRGFSLSWADYAGVLPLLLGALALVLRPSWGRFAVAFAGFACMSVVFGLWPIFDIVTALPGFSSGHNTRLIAVYMLCLALLSGWGLDDVTGPPVPRRRLIAGAGVVLALVALPAIIVLAGEDLTTQIVKRGLDVAWRFAPYPSSPDTTAPAVVRIGSLSIWLFFAAGALALLFARWRLGLAVAATVALAVGLTFTDLVRAGMGLNPAVTDEAAHQTTPPVVAHLQKHRPARFVRMGGVPPNVFPMRYRLYDASGYDLPLERRFDRLWRTRLSPEYPSQVGKYPQTVLLSLPRLTRSRLRVLSLLGVRDIVMGPGDEPPRVRGVKRTYSGADAKVYENPDPFPRTWLAGDQEVVTGGEAALDALDRRDLDLRRTVVVEAPVRSLPAAGGRAAADAGRARLKHYGDERVEISVRARRPGVVVLSDAWYPGWKATVDGRDAPVQRVDYVLRGVRVPAGRHTVKMRYAPGSWRLAWIVSLIGVAALIAIAAVGLIRRRRPPAPY